MRRMSWETALHGGKKNKHIPTGFHVKDGQHFRTIKDLHVEGKTENEEEFFGNRRRKILTKLNVKNSKL